jgi:hypothetical protein
MRRTKTLNIKVKDKKILLVASTDLNKDSVGKLFLESLIKFTVGVDVKAFTQPQFMLTWGKYFNSMVGNFLIAVLSRIGLLQTLRILIYKFFYLNKDVDKILLASEENETEIIWLTLSTIELILIANILVKTQKCIKVTVWDAPEYLSQSIRLYKKSTQQVMKAFEEVIKYSNKVSVISDAMENKYLNLYDVKSIVIRHVIPPCTLVVKKTHRHKIRIVFAGSLYSKTEWNNFIDALNAVKWIINKKPVFLYFIGRFPLTGVKSTKKIIFVGEKTFSDTMKLMTRMNIGYLPYWFAEKFSIVARTSFPGKLSAYAASGVAIFHHAPAYTEAANFLKLYPFGLTCSSLESDPIIQALSKLDHYANTEICDQARQSALQTELSTATMSKRFNDFLN